jgi:hypothetical protein
MLKRHDKLRESLFSYQDNRTYPVEQLHVFALGDMLSGSIHDELVATNEIPMAEATVQLGLDGAEWLESLTERFPRVHVTGVVGNHPRAHKKPWAKQGFDNADWTSYHVMATALKRNPRVTFDIPKANQHRITIAERWPVLLWHSDGVRSSMPGVPWGGIVRRVTALRAQYSSVGKPVNYFFSGHFHTANAVEGGTVVVNGSVKGVDEYSLKAFGGGRPAQQVLATFHPLLLHRPSGGRMREDVRTFLAEAAAKADIAHETSVVQAAAKDRLDKGAEEYGEEAYKAKTPEEVLGEMGEEAIDYPTWSALFALLCREGDFFLPEDGEHLAICAQELSAKVLRVWRDSTHQMAEMVEEARQNKALYDAKTTPPPPPVTCLDTP